MVDFIFFFSAKKGQEIYKIPDVGIFAKKVKLEFCDFDFDNHGTNIMIIWHNAILLQANTSRRMFVLCFSHTYTYTLDFRILS